MDKREVVLLQKRFELIKKIGSGSFGHIYLAKDTLGGLRVAVKIEKPRKSESSVDMIQREVNVLSLLTGQLGFPTLLGHGTVNKESWMAISLHGINLGQASKRGTTRGLSRDFLGGREGLAVQMVTRLETLHNTGYLHRDIKPENFLLERTEVVTLDSQSITCQTGNSNTTNNNSDSMSQTTQQASSPREECSRSTLYLVDYGLSKRWNEHGVHVAYREKKGMVGTARYVSLNTHHGIEQSRRDDLEAIGYLLMYLHKGRLPWQDLNLTDKKEKFKRIKEMK